MLGVAQHPLDVVVAGDEPQGALGRLDLVDGLLPPAVRPEPVDVGLIDRFRSGVGRPAGNVAVGGGRHDSDTTMSAVTDTSHTSVLAT